MGRKCSQMRSVSLLKLRNYLKDNFFWSQLSQINRPGALMYVNLSRDTFRHIWKCKELVPIIIDFKARVLDAKGLDGHFRVSSIIV